MKPAKKVGFLSGVVLCGLVVFLSRGGDDPEEEIHNRMEAVIEWFEEGAGLSGLAVGLHARKVESHFTEAVEFAVPGWTGTRNGRGALMQLMAATFQRLESVNFRQTFEIQKFDLELEVAEGILEITANLRAADGASGRHEARLGIFFRLEEGNWKIDRVIPL